MKEFLWEVRRRLKARRFPAYAPELNPDEMIWSALKDQQLPNFCPKTEEEIREGVERKLGWLLRHPDFVAGCIRHAKIPLNVRETCHLLKAKGDSCQGNAARGSDPGSRGATHPRVIGGC